MVRLIFISLVIRLEIRKLFISVEIEVGIALIEKEKFINSVLGAEGFSFIHMQTLCWVQVSIDEIYNLCQLGSTVSIYPEVTGYFCMAINRWGYSCHRLKFFLNFAHVLMHLRH